MSSDDDEVVPNNAYMSTPNARDLYESVIQNAAKDNFASAYAVPMEWWNNFCTGEEMPPKIDVTSILDELDPKKYKKGMKEEEDYKIITKEQLFILQKL